MKYLKFNATNPTNPTNTTNTINKQKACMILSADVFHEWVTDLV